MFRMETVSLNDDASSISSTPSSSTVVDVKSLEDQLVSPEISVPGVESDTVKDDRRLTKDLSLQTIESFNDQMKKGNEMVVMVDVENQQKDSNGPVASQNENHQLGLPPLRILTHNLPLEERDYVDTTLFSPEVSRHAMEVAHRRAKAIAMEVKEMMELDAEVCGAGNDKLSSAEAVGIIGSAFLSSLKRVKKMVKPGLKEYDLLSGTSPSGETSRVDDDLDTDGDGLQLSPDAAYNDGKNFCPTKLKPALKRISAYSTAAALEPEKTLSTRSDRKKRIVWHEEVLDADEEFCEDDTDGQETRLLMNADQDAVGIVNGSLRPQLLNYSSKSSDQLASRSRKKRKKLVRSLMRRLTPREKEELYRQRPDLMIVPNWAQKYREELAVDGSTHWNAWLLALIMLLAVLLLVFILLIVRQRIAAAK